MGDYLILFDVGCDWYGCMPYLIEQLILRVYDAGSCRVEVAIAALDALAAEHGCVAIASGDTQRGKMVPLYHAAGFVTLGTQLLKVLPHGVHPNREEADPVNERIGHTATNPT